jgi:2-methylaconitate cis-trans-isomerase PrpF
MLAFPLSFINAEAIGYKGTELQDDINSDPKALEIFEKIRAYGSLRMGLITQLEEAAKRQHTPKVAFVAKPADYIASSGKEISAKDINVLVRAMSMGKLHHAMMGTAAVAIGTAAAIQARWSISPLVVAIWTQCALVTLQARCAWARRPYRWMENGKLPKPS